MFYSIADSHRDWRSDAAYQGRAKKFRSMAAPGVPAMLGIGAIISLLPIGFYLRLAFWLVIVILLLSSG
jgi:hypothetical protein